MRNDKEHHLLLRDVAGGNDRAFWKVWQRYRPHLYDISLRHMSGIQADADDAMSRSMLLAREKLPDYAASIDNLEAWLTRLTCNVCIDIHRERSRARRDAVGLDDIAAEEQPIDRGLSPEKECLMKEMRSAITTAIADLPPRLRDVVRLRFFQEMSYDAIARSLSITAENARKRAEQARAALQDRLGELH